MKVTAGRKSWQPGQLNKKQFGLKAAGAEVTPDALTKINSYALAPLTADQVYVRKYIMAHNCVDRDRERFPEALLDDFARTLPGKSLLKAHERDDLPIGLFFDASTEEITPEQFKALTGEDPRLPEGLSMVKVLWGWIYLLKSDFNNQIMSNIDGGIYRHASIGFKASDLIAVKGPFDQVLYFEYMAPGEALEGSIVWLGAQPGATAQKAPAGAQDNTHKPSKSNTGGNTMDWKTLAAMFKRLFGSKAFSEDNLENDLKDAVAEYVKSAVDAAVAALTAKVKELEPLEAKVKELSPLAEEGKAYRAGLVTEYVAMKAKVGDIDEKPETAEKAKTIASGFPIDFLQAETAVLKARVAEKFPSTGELGKNDDDATGKRAQGGEKKNPLIPEGGK